VKRLPAGVIMTIYFILWQVMYPREVWDSIMFRDPNIFVSILSWIFLIGFVGTITLIVHYITD
jgi:hypothetical protein